MSGLALFKEWQPPPRDVRYYRSERDDAAESKSSERAALDLLVAMRQEAPAATPRFGDRGAAAEFDVWRRVANARGVRGCVRAHTRMKGRNRVAK